MKFIVLILNIGEHSVVRVREWYGLEPVLITDQTTNPNPQEPVSGP